MEVNEIEAFVTITRVGSFTRAATILYISQPAISRCVELLERELGAPLFERFPAGVRLVEAGRAFLPHAEQVLAAMHDGAEVVRGQLIEANFGIGLLPASSIEEKVRLGTLQVLPMAALQTSVPVMVISRCQGYLSRAARRLQEMLAMQTTNL